MWYYDWNYPKTSAIKTTGGIKAQSKKGFGQSWWAKQWLSALEKFTDTSRLARGRTYARKGQVLSIDIQKGEILARVQGSQVKPYRVKIAHSILSLKDWEYIMSNKTLFSIVNDRSASRFLDIAFGDSSNKRKKWLEGK